MSGFPLDCAGRLATCRTWAKPGKAAADPRAVNQFAVAFVMTASCDAICRNCGLIIGSVCSRIAFAIEAAQDRYAALQISPKFNHLIKFSVRMPLIATKGGFGLLLYNPMIAVCCSFATLGLFPLCKC